jgi:hypothetical protein
MARVRGFLDAHQQPRVAVTVRAARRDVTLDMVILVTDSDDALLGVGFLAGGRLLIDWAQGPVPISPRSPKGKRK